MQNSTTVLFVNLFFDFAYDRFSQNCRI